MSVEGGADQPDRAEQTPDVSSHAGQFVIELLESAAQAILSVDQTGRIVQANRRAEEMFGYTRAELLGSAIKILLPESELAGRRRDGSEFPVEVNLNTIKTAEGTFALAFVTDISRRKQLEEQLMRAQKMEAVSRLAGGVAHDFNNLLTVIAGYSRMILDELPSQELPEYAELRVYAEEIGKAADRASALTNQLLAFSRRQLVQSRVMNVNALLAQAEKTLLRLLGGDIRLTLDLEESLGNIKADPDQVEQAIVNLAINARDAMAGGGEIFLQTAEVDLDEAYAQTHPGVKPGGYVMIAITDTGRGMDAEVRQHIFEPFFTTKERGKRAGLGLASVYGMVKQSGGDIQVSSELGKGTTFHLYFPRNAEMVSQTGREEAAHITRHSNDTVLVVEDEKPVRDLTVRMLQQLGYNVLAAASGAEAIEISNTYSGKIALLLTDVIMPEMSGRQVADALLPLRPDMKVIFFSGYAEHTTIHQGIGSGVNFLPKPFSRETLSRKLLEVTHGRER
jgi:two-component system, cell cycle sensor histidine kinase and response regulator CckA